MLILGAGDSIAALLLIRDLYNFSVANAVVIFFAVYLIIKGVVFIADIGSMMDIVGGILLLLTLSFSIPSSFLIIFAILIGLKGFMTLLGGVHV